MSNRRSADWTTRAVCLCVGCKHLILAAALMLSHSADRSTVVATLLLVIPDRIVLLAVLLSASLAALFAIEEMDEPLWRALALAPQQMLVLITAIGAGTEAVLGHYADGYVPDGGSLFIITDQLPRIILAIVHSVAIWRHMRPQ